MGHLQRPKLCKGSAVSTSCPLTLVWVCQTLAGLALQQLKAAESQFTPDMHLNTTMN
jgi:hypothetical protein